MIGLQRILMLCLLAIAGSGPLPLWLHHAVCHGTACHGTACNVPVGQGHSHQAAEEVHSHASCCGHNHQTPAAKLAGKAAEPIANWQAASDSHEDCAVCYTLSQLTTAQPTNDVLVSLLRSQYLVHAGDSQTSLQSWLAYSSRGPPTV